MSSASVVYQELVSGLRCSERRPAPLLHKCARVLFVGESWFGSCARACSAALRHRGYDVQEIDTQTFFPQWMARDLRVWRRLLAPRIVADFNAYVLAMCRSFRPDFFLTFKGMFIRLETLKQLRESGVRLYNYFPDRMIFVRGSELESALPEYDCVFDTKRSWDGDMHDRLRLRDRVFLPHGYDPEIHRPVPLPEQDQHSFTCDVSFIGTHTPRKERLLDELARNSQGFSIRIFGNGWNRCRSPRLRQFIHGSAVCGQSYAKVIAASRINLALMGVSDAALDETSTRTYEIPACKGFMLHERTEEVRTLYEEGREMACFSSGEELAAQIAHYLQKPTEMKVIAEAGYRRAVPHYSYENRIEQILNYHYTT